MPGNSKVSFVSVGATSQELLGPSPNRTALIFLGGNAGRVTISNDSPAVLDNGLTIIQQMGEIKLLYSEVGSVVCAPWFAIAAVAGTVIGIIETVEG